MSDNTEISIWSAGWFKLKSSIVGFWSFILTNILAAASFLVSLIDGIAAFFTFLYTALPPIAERLVNAFTTCSDFITNVFTTSAESALESTEEVVGLIQSTEVTGDNGASFWEMVKYMVNADALSEFLNFIVSIGWFWIFIVVMVLVVATGFLLAGCTIHVTRRFIVFVSAGFVKVG